jgi:hypothetical protein
MCKPKPQGKLQGEYTKLDSMSELNISVPTATQLIIEKAKELQLMIGGAKPLDPVSLAELLAIIEETKKMLE